MKDFCDGTAFQSSALYSMHPEALQIFLYFDEVEICNPKTKTHKLGNCVQSHAKYFSHLFIFYCAGMFYFTLGNLSPKYRSYLPNIQLLAIVKTTVISTYGINKILKPFVDDVKKLVRCFSSPLSFDCIYRNKVLSS